jgi:hypothetical protein
MLEDLRYHAKNRQWFGLVNDLSTVNAVELTVEGEQDPAGLAPKLALVRKLAADADAVLEQLHQLAYQKYQNTPWAKPLAEIRTMYCLSGVTLKRDNTTWWLVLEPAFNAGAIYDHFLRFTMVNREIVWANFAHDTIA